MPIAALMMITAIDNQPTETLTLITIITMTVMTLAIRTTEEATRADVVPVSI
jgi:hypothetical protein